MAVDIGAQQADRLRARSGDARLELALVAQQLLKKRLLQALRRACRFFTGPLPVLRRLAARHMQAEEHVAAGKEHLPRIGMGPRKEQKRLLRHLAEAVFILLQKDVVNRLNAAFEHRGQRAPHHAALMAHIRCVEAPAQPVNGLGHRRRHLRGDGVQIADARRNALRPQVHGQPGDERLPGLLRGYSDQQMDPPLPNAAADGLHADLLRARGIPLAQANHAVGHGIHVLQRQLRRIAAVLHLRAAQRKHPAVMLRSAGADRLKGFAQQHRDLLRIDRLEHVAADAEFDAALGVVKLIVGSQHNRLRAGNFLPAQGLQQLQPVHLRHLNVQQHDLRMMRPDQRQGLHAVLRMEHVVKAQRGKIERLLQIHVHRMLVVDHQQLHDAFPLSACPPSGEGSCPAARAGNRSSTTVPSGPESMDRPYAGP